MKRNSFLTEMSFFEFPDFSWMSLSASFLSIGSPVPFTASLVTMHFATSSIDGTSYLTYFITFSIMVREPRGTSFYAVYASSAISSNASSSNVNSTPSRG